MTIRLRSRPSSPGTRRRGGSPAPVKTTPASTTKTGAATRNTKASPRTIAESPATPASAPPNVLEPARGSSVATWLQWYSYVLPFACVFACLVLIVALPDVDENGYPYPEGDRTIDFLNPLKNPVYLALVLVFAWSMRFGEPRLRDSVAEAAAAAGASTTQLERNWSVYYAAERLLMHWHLSNALFWSGGCDSFSGFLQLVPKFRVLYDLVDSRHGIFYAPAVVQSGTPRVPLAQTEIANWNTLRATDRSPLDSVYFGELTFHVPLSFLTFLLYATQHKKRYVVEALVSGGQIVGTYAYYMPGVWDGGLFWPTDNLLILFPAIIAAVFWVVLPFWCVIRAFRLPE